MPGINLSKASAQAVYDHIVIHVALQGKPSMLGNSLESRCVYTTDEGCHCGAGWVIPQATLDTLYTRGNKHKKGNTAMYGHLVMGKVVTPNHQLLVEDCQYAHDDASSHSHFVTKFLYMMRNVASRHNLDPGVLGFFMKDSSAIYA